MNGSMVDLCLNGVQEVAGQRMGGKVVHGKNRKWVTYSFGQLIGWTCWEVESGELAG